MGRICGGSGRGYYRDYPVLSLVIYLNEGKRILLAEEYSNNPSPYEAAIREIQKEIEIDNMEVRGIPELKR